MVDIKLEPATPADEIFVNSLTRSTMRQYVEATWPDETRREHYYSLNLFHLPTTSIIYCNGERAGRLTITRAEREIILDDIHLLPQFQGRGIGKNLIADVIEEGRRNGKDISLMVLKTNPAKALYEHLGFQVYNESAERFYMRVKV